MEPNRKRFWSCLGASFAVWILWCISMTYIGQPFSLPLVRAVVRVGAVAIPALVYVLGGSVLGGPVLIGPVLIGLESTA